MQTLTHTLRRTVLLLALALVASLWLAPATMAQPTPEEMQARMAAQMDDTIKQLGLTGEKADTVRAILEDGNTKRMELRKEARASGSFTGMRDKMMALNEETETKLGEVLTEAQMTQYKKIIEERRSQRGGRRGF